MGGIFKVFPSACAGQASVDGWLENKEKANETAQTFSLQIYKCVSVLYPGQNTRKQINRGVSLLSADSN